jgi:hypothetical protein
MRARTVSATVLLVAAPPASIPFAVPRMPLVREDEPVLDPTAALQNVRVLGVVVALADDICRTEFEFLRQRGGACPLNIVFVVVGAGILAAHHVDFIVPACGAADAFELVNGLVGAFNIFSGRITCGSALTRLCEVCRSFRSVRLCTLESLTLAPERRADAPLAASSAG